MYRDLSQAEGTYYEANIDYSVVMRKYIHKHTSYLQPIFEAMSNAFEALKDPLSSSITICLNTTATLFSEQKEFVSLDVIDTGVGFTEENMRRFEKLFDESKGFNNFGSGRIQYLHFFQQTEIESVFEDKGQKHKRVLVLSKKFIDKHNSIMWKSLTEDCLVDTACGTKVSFYIPLETNDKSLYSSLTTDKLRDEIMIRYLSKLCISKPNNPIITIEEYKDGVLLEGSIRTIENKDIPSSEYSTSTDIHYSFITKDGDIAYSQKTEKFDVTSYKLPLSLLTKNTVKLVSKNEAVDVPNVDFSLVTNAAKVDDSYRLFLISSDYLTNKDSDVRGKLTLYNRERFLKERNLFTTESVEILIEDIHSKVVTEIANKYSSIASTQKAYKEELDGLIEMFNLDRDTVLKTTNGKYESSLSILRNVYTYDAELKAKKDDQLKTVYDSVSDLDPLAHDFQKKLAEKVNKVTRLIPEINRTEITSYVSKRRLILTLFQNILEKRLKCQQTLDKKKREKDKSETLFHSLLFPKNTEDSYNSNLWMINDDFIHFDGVSDEELSKIEYHGKKIIREDLSEKDLERLNAYGRKRLGKRPDILLFPSERRCIIIELKSINVDVCKYLDQATQYASLIAEFSKPQFAPTYFFTYLIGENFTDEDVFRSNSGFKKDEVYGHLYRYNIDIYALVSTKIN